MEIVLNYLERMFAELPDTQEVRRIKDGMAEMMEEKYAELLAEGKSENEAIGTVIAEFGSIEELAGEFDIDQISTLQTDCAVPQKEVIGRSVTTEECRCYLDTMTGLSRGIGAGVMLILLSLIFPIQGEEIFGSEKGEALGTVFMFVMIAVSVILFIVDGIAMSRFDNFKKEVLLLERSTLETLQKEEQAEQKQFVIKIAVGVTLCIFSLIPSILNESVLHWDENLPSCILFVMVGLAVYLFITAGIRHGCYQVLLQRQTYAPQQKKASKHIETIAGIYWPCIVMIYLVYSLITHNWEISWIIWPVAALLFVVITTICKAVFSEKEMDR